MPKLRPQSALSGQRGTTATRSFVRKIPKISRKSRCRISEAELRLLLVEQALLNQEVLREAFLVGARNVPNSFLFYKRVAASSCAKAAGIRSLSMPYQWQTVPRLILGIRQLPR